MARFAAGQCGCNAPLCGRLLRDKRLSQRDDVAVLFPQLRGFCGRGAEVSRKLAEDTGPVAAHAWAQGTTPRGEGSARGAYLIFGVVRHQFREVGKLFSTWPRRHGRIYKAGKANS